MYNWVFLYVWCGIKLHVHIHWSSYVCVSVCGSIYVNYVVNSEESTANPTHHEHLPRNEYFLYTNCVPST